MEVTLDKRYPLAVGVEAAWAVLVDVRAVAACMPGAQITEQVDETHFKGVVRSKVGPATMTFNGDIEVLSSDAAARALEMLGKGADKGGSSASMKLAARLEAGESAGSSVLVGVATVIVSGKLAQFGGRLLVPIADAMLAQFAANFETQAAAIAPTPPTAAAATEAAEPAAVVEADVADADTAPASPVPLHRRFDASTVAPPDAPARAAPPPPRELNALGLLWAVLRGWLQGLFGNKTA